MRVWYGIREEMRRGEVLRGKKETNHGWRKLLVTMETNRDSSPRLTLTDNLTP